MSADPETERVLDALLWMADNPGEWYHWSARPHSASSRHVRRPSFERLIVSDGSAHDHYGPHGDMEPGLWVRYVGGGDAHVTHTLRDVA